MSPRRRRPRRPTDTRRDTPAPPAAPRDAALPRLAGPTFVAFAFVGLAAWSWGKWADIHIDFGNELYLAWRLAEGDRLGADLAYRHGPLSQHVNALWFSVFGVSVRTLVLCNLAILAGVCVLAYRFLARTSGRAAATAGTLTLLGVFAFGQYVSIGNFNFVTPYQHNQTHGLALSLVMLACLSRALRDPGASARWLAGAGACLGLVFLTKAELFVAAASAMVVGVALLLARRRTGASGAIGAGAGAALAVIGLAFAALATRLPAADAWRQVLGNWAYVGGAVADPFYRWGAGLDDVGANLATALTGLVGIAAVAGAALLVDRLAPGARRLPIAAAAGAALALLVGVTTRPESWWEVPRALPLVAALATLALGVACFTGRASIEGRGPLLLWATFALALLGKMILYARVEHYGFVLALPATLLLVALLVGEVPALAARLHGGGTLAGALLAGLVLAGLAAHVEWSQRFYRHKTVEVGEGGDRLLVTEPAAGAREAMLWETIVQLRSRVGPDETLLALPEGLSLNYWLRRRTPTRHWLFLPPELAAVGGDAPIVAALEQTPPDHVVLVGRGHEEFGVGPFGVDPRNGRDLLAWIRARYASLAVLGAKPFTGPLFGIELLGPREEPDAQRSPSR